MRYSCVLFDLDGTVVDTIDLIVRAAQHAFGACDMPIPSRPAIMAGIGRPLLEQFHQYATTQQQVDDLVVAYRQYQMAHHDELTSAYDGIGDELRYLKSRGTKTGVVTSKIEPLAHRALNLVGLADCFDIVVGIESTTRHKPNADPLLFAMRALDASNPQSIYIGDSPFDIQAAHAAKIASIAVTWGAFDHSTLSAERPSHIAERPAELRQYLVASS